MKDQQARDSATSATHQAFDAHDRIGHIHQRLNAIERRAADVTRTLAREQQRLAAEVAADQIVDDLVDAARARVLTSHDEKIAKLEARVDALTEQLAVALPAEPYAPEQVTDEDLIESAILRESVIEFCYQDREGIESLRLVSPYDFADARNGARLLVGYDHDRDGIRQFRIERIAAVETDDTIPYRPPLSE